MKKSIVSGALAFTLACTPMHASQLEELVNKALEHTKKSEYQLASETFTQAIQRAPMNASLYHLLASALSYSFQGDNAIKAQRVAVKLKPDEYVYQNTLCKLLYEFHHYDDAITEYKILFDTFNEKAEDYIGLGKCYFIKEDFKKALENFHTAKKKDKNNVEALYLDGLTHHKLGEHDNAAITYKKAIQKSPDEVRYHNALAICLFEMGKHTEAMKEFNQCTKIAPTEALYFMNYSIALIFSGKKPEAVEAFKKATELNPKLRVKNSLLNMTTEMFSFY